MFLDELADQIWNNSKFKADYEALLSNAARKSLSISENTRSNDWREVLRRLLQSATHFASTSNHEYREAAYRIATGASALYGQEYENIRDVATVILGRLGNFPAINLLFGSADKSYAGFPEPLWFEIEAHETANSVQVNSHAEILTDFQRRLWSSLTAGLSTAVTAPTSAGKSFALQRFLTKTFASKGGWAVYLVPTRALLNQVAESLEDLLKTFGLSRSVFTIPVSPVDLNASAGIYVLTQERLQLLLEAAPSLTFSLVIVDEAQLVADGGRGVILEVVVAKLRSRLSEIQFLFGSPQTKNPEVFQSIFGLPSLTVIQEFETPVAQNLIFVDTDSIMLNEITISALLNNTKIELSKLNFPLALYDDDQRLASISWHLGKNQKNIVYAGGQARCEIVANQLVQLVRTQPSEMHQSQDITDFSKFLREYVHPQFLLADSILHKVAFHYGNMPPIIRKNVEELFAEGNLDYLVCTSTLLHGVNLPARNLFLLDPTKGIDWETREDIPISSLEFWNLSGRAGRLGKEFEGNVFLIDEAKWQSKPLEGERQQTVEAATKKTVTEKTQEFIDFVKNSNHPSGKRAAEENTFVKLYIDSKRNTLSQTLDKFFGEATSATKELLIKTVSENSAAISVPDAIVERNISVSIYRQQEMLDYLVEGIKEKGAPRYIPIHPLRDWEETLPSLRLVFKRIHTHFEKLPGRNKMEFYFAPLALRWMRGEPLRSLIDGAYEYKQAHQRSVKIATVIRDVFSDVEKELRFRYVKYVACYNDLLGEALRRTGTAEMVTRIPAIPLFLEIGASSGTMLNLVGLGLSRSAASAITQIAVQKDMDRAATEKFLAEQNWEGLGLSPVLVKELNKLVGGTSSGNAPN